MSCFGAIRLMIASVFSHGGVEVVAQHVENVSLRSSRLQSIMFSLLFHRKKKKKKPRGMNEPAATLALVLRKPTVNPLFPPPVRPVLLAPPTDDFSREKPRKHRYGRGQECGRTGLRWNARRENVDYTWGMYTG